MTVIYTDRTLPLSGNASNPAFSANVNLAWDFTGMGALPAGAAWVFDGGTNPTFVKTGTVNIVTANGEPGIVSSATSLYDFNSTTNYGLQAGTSDFTIALRVSTPAALPTTNNGTELFRISGSAGTTISIVLSEFANNGWYVSGAGSTAMPLGTVQSAVIYPNNRTIMVWIRKQSGIVTVHTQDVTAQGNIVTRYAAGAAASAGLDSTRAARTIACYSASGTTTTVLSSIKRWAVALADSTMSAIGKDYWDTESNGAATAAIAITTPTAGSTIAATSVISGTYTGTAPAGIEVQHNGGSWVLGTAATISGGAWSASFVLPPGTGSLIARESSAPAVVSSAVTGITVTSDSISFTTPPTTHNGAVPFRIFQRDASNQASVRITGAYSGSPSAIEYAWNGGAFSTLVSMPSGGVFDATVSLTGPAQGAIVVRFANAPSVAASCPAVGVGDVFIVAGQSNHVGGGAGMYVPATPPVSHPGWVASIYDKTGRWRENVETATDPFSKTTNASIYPAASATYSAQAASATAYNSYFGELASRCWSDGIPVAFVPCALGSTAISTWAVSLATTTLYGAMLAVATTIGAHKGVLWWQGEADCSVGTTRSAYAAALDALITDWCVTRFPGSKWVLMNLNATGNSVGTGGTGASDTGFAAIHAAIEEVASSNINVSGIGDMNGAFSGSVHYSSSADIVAVATVAKSAIGRLLGVLRSATVMLVDQAGAPRVNLAGLKWAWFDQNQPQAFASPTAQGVAETTASDGSLTVNLPNTSLAAGQVGWLVVTDSDGVPSNSYKAFSGPVSVA